MGSSVMKEILKLLQTSFPHRSYWLVSVAMHFLTKFTSLTTISPFRGGKSRREKLVKAFRPVSQTEHQLSATLENTAAANTEILSPIKPEPYE